MTTIVHPRLAPRRSTARARTWWGKAWVRAIEEAAYADADLVASRTLARGGHVGQIATEPGRFVASVEDRRGLWTVSGSIPVLDDGAVSALVEAVAAESGRIAALLAGDLPFSLVEHAEEAGVELLPYGAELSSSCTCDHWADPCTHALAVLQQVTWLVEADPFVLLQLRGLPRDELLGRLHARTEPAGDAAGDVAGDIAGDEDVDLDAAVEAALYAARLLTDAEPSDVRPAAPPAPSA